MCGKLAIIALPFFVHLQNNKSYMFFTLWIKSERNTHVGQMMCN